MMRRWIALLCALGLLMLCGCGVAEKILNEDGLKLYYPTVLSSSQGGDAIGSVNVGWDKISQGDKQAQAEEILALLMGGCTDKAFRSPIPAGVTLQSCEIRGSTVYVDFSTAYGQLSGMDMTVADYCVTLSLTQIPDIYAVHITVGGKELAYRDTNRFLASDVLLSSTDDVVRTLAVRLYFPDESGVLAPEERLLSLYEGETRVGVIVDALLDGPESETLQPLVPDGFEVLSVRVENGICYLNLPEDAAGMMADNAVAGYGFVNSLCELEDVNEVWFFTEGEYQNSYTAEQSAKRHSMLHMQYAVSFWCLKTWK